MIPGEVHIRKLRIGAEERRMPPGFRPGLDDAFGTASVSGLPPGAILAVRRLATGRLTASVSRAALKRIVGAQLSEAYQEAVRGDSSAAGGAASVWFPNMTAAYAAYAQASAAGSGARAWYWPLLLGRWAEAAAFPQAVVWALNEAAGLDNGAKVQGEIVSTVARARRLGALLDALSSDTAAQWIDSILPGRAPGAGKASSHPDTKARRTGEAPAPARAPNERRVALPAMLLEPAIIARLRAWGRGDPRTHWLVAIGHAIDGPVPSAARIEEVLRIVVGCRPQRWRTSRDTGAARAETQAAARSSSDARFDASPGQAARRDVPPDAPEAGRANSPPHAETGSTQSAVAASEPASDADPRPGSLDRPFHSAETRPLESRAREAPRGVGMDRHTLGERSAFVAPMRDAETGGTTAAHHRGEEATAEPEHRVWPAPPEPAEDQSLPPQPPDTADASEFAGDFVATDFARLAFVLPVLVRFEMGEWLSDNSTLHDACFAHRLMQFVAHRCGVPPDDVAAAAFRAPDWADRLPKRLAFTLPAAAWAFAAAPEGGALRIVRLPGEPGWRALAGGSGGVLLACWRGRMPVDLRRRIAGRPLRRVRLCGSRHVGAWLLASWWAILVRAVRHHAGMSLRALVRQHGLISLTATHLDVVLPGAEADIRIRRAGLDLDPGWLSWLGLVVAFHYRFDAVDE